MDAKPAPYQVFLRRQSFGARCRRPGLRPDAVRKTRRRDNDGAQPFLYAICLGVNYVTIAP